MPNELKRACYSTSPTKFLGVDLVWGYAFLALRGDL
jgi:hypothetical protein